MILRRGSPTLLTGAMFTLAVLACGCETVSTAFDNGMCAIGTSGVPLNLENAVQREITGDGPNGSFGQTFSRENWDQYWNDRIYNLWDSVPDCGRATRGPTGREAILAALARRTALGLPNIELESRNTDKDLGF